MAARKNYVGTKIADRYIITGEIGAGGMGRVFRAMPFDDPSQDVAIKVILRNQTLDSEDLLRFQKEAALMSRLHHPNIIYFHELGILAEKEELSQGLGSGYYIVMEIANGRNLKESLALDSRKDLAFFFEVGLQVTAALDYTHGKNIIHRDIKPQNIVVGRAFREQRGVLVKVLDFGVARLTEVIGQGGDGLSDVAGTPMYMAPEQTPLLTAPIDHRVDLYSLGCVLYEILAGRPPFSAKTRDKLMRQHVYATPEALTAIRPDIPKVIADIVHKLLAKHPDDRYQTAFGLYSDLQRAKAKLTGGNRGGVDFPLGLNDSFRSVSANLDLVGREEEFATLLDNFQAISSDKGRSRLVVIKGSAGTGKTRLLTEFRSHLTRKKIRYISTSFSRHENNLPFNALANGFNEYLIRVLKSQPHEAEEVRRKVKTLLGPMALRVAEVVPGLKPYIDPELAASVEAEKKDDLAGDEEQVPDFQTFAKAFSDFTRCLAPNQDPVVFIFDDMHWADEKSLQLIDQFFSHNNSQRFLMVVGFQPQAAAASRPFHEFVAKFSKMRRRFAEINLGEFSAVAVERLAANMLNDEASVTPELATFLRDATAGNPMYLVEMIRSLVAQELISSSNEGGRKWHYDMNAIRGVRIGMDSVDLTLSRLQVLDAFDRSVVELAAVIGVTFQFELLMLDRRIGVERAQASLSRAVTEGFVTRAPEEDELAHLGKAYSFTHPRVREAILDTISRERKRDLHRLIFLHLEESIPKPGPKTIFTMAHHINQVLGDGGAPDSALAQKGVKPNVDAGRVAMKARSWQSAQHYFENAQLLLGQLPESDARTRQIAYVLEALADLASRQSRNSKAIDLYNAVLAMPLTAGVHLKVAAKSAALQIAGGQLSQAVMSLKSTFGRFGLRFPVKTTWATFRALVRLFIDGLPLFQSGPAMQLLNRPRRTAEEVLPLAELYRMAQLAKMRDDPEHAFILHDEAARHAVKGRAAPGTRLKIAGERAIVLGHFGFMKRAYRIMDEAMDAAAALPQGDTQYELLLWRTLTLDSYKAKFDELDRNLETALEHLNPDRERLAYATGVTALMTSYLLRGSRSRLEALARQIPLVVSTRSWLSSRGVALYLIQIFFEDSRDTLVRQGESYLRRRAEVGGRTNDTFLVLIKTMVAFAKGEIDRTRRHYAELVVEFLKGAEKEYLFPFEEDVLMMFLLILPDLFAQEHGKILVSEGDEKRFLSMLRARASYPRNRNRAMAKLAVARVEERLGGRRVKYLYDEALHTARLGNQAIVEMFALLWFGQRLLEEGKAARRDYLERVHKESARRGLQLIVSLTEKTMERLEVPFQSVRIVRKSEEKAPAQDKMASVVHEHLKHLCDVMPLDTALEGHLHESLTLLARHYHFSRATCFVLTSDRDDLEIVYPVDETGLPPQLKDYVLPYLNVRSTLFLPVSDAPWYQRREGERAAAPSLSVVQTTMNSDEQKGEFAENLEKTQVLTHDTEERMNLLDLEASTEEKGQDSTRGKGKADRRAGDRSDPPMRAFMNTLIPIRCGDRNIGLIMLEKMRLESESSLSYRHDLDQIGAQLGIMIHAKTDIEAVRRLVPAKPRYQPGQYQLESAPWLSLWTQGGLRKEREATWYLGLRLGSDDYLLVYSRLNGAPELRDHLSPQIWYHLETLRSLAIVGGRNTFAPHELREELTGLLKKDARFRQLEGLSLSFTLFNFEQRTASSGHFGPSRPLVLCVENEVTPFNEEILSQQNGRVLRYWEVRAKLIGAHTYILCHDSSKLDSIPTESLEKPMSSQASPKQASANLYRLLDKMLIREHVPRYYVGAVMSETRKDEHEELAKAQ